MNRSDDAELSRWERSKSVRRSAILDAARSLIREHGPQVSVEKIAQRAGVATATVYNLIGPREQLLGMLLSDLFETMLATIEGMNLADPFLIGDAVVVVSARMFIADTSLWLHVIPETRGAFGVRVQRFVSFHPINVQRQAMRTAKDIGMLNPSADAEMTAAQIYATYIGSLLLWADGYISDEGFLNQAKAGYWAVLAALGAGEHRRRALRELNALHSARARALLAEIDLASTGTSSHAVVGGTG